MFFHIHPLVTSSSTDYGNEPNIYTIKIPIRNIVIFLPNAQGVYSVKVFLPTVYTFILYTDFQIPYM